MALALAPATMCDGLGDVGRVGRDRVAEDDIFGRVEADVGEGEGVAECVADLRRVVPLQILDRLCRRRELRGVLVELSRDSIRVVGVAART